MVGAWSWGIWCLSRDWDLHPKHWVKKKNLQKEPLLGACLCIQANRIPNSLLHCAMNSSSWVTSDSFHIKEWAELSKSLKHWASFSVPGPTWPCTSCHGHVVCRGNLVLARCKEHAIPYRLLGQSKLVKSFGISLSLIDFTLSRLDTGSQTHPCHSLVLLIKDRTIIWSG